jgi:dihydroflavonol-4-reductase
MSIDNKKILVTGASGQLGRKLVLKLHQLGFSVRAHYRSEDKARRWCPPGVEAVLGDLKKPGWLPEAADGCQSVIHCAAWVSLGPRDYNEMQRINVEGTRAVIDACRKKNVSRLIHISSVAAVGASTNGTIIDESFPFNLHDFNIPYFTTKYLAEQEAIKASDDKMKAIVLNPSIMISPSDRKISREELKRIPHKIPFYFDFGLNVVRTEDVIDAVIAALKKGRGGQRYILAGENIDAARAFQLSEKFLDLKKPIFKLPYALLYIVAAVFELCDRLGLPFTVKIAGWKLNRQVARLARLKFIYSSEKARNELGFNPRPLEQSIKEILASVDLNQT